MTFEYPTSKDIWKAIQDDYDVSKIVFGQKINFVQGEHKRKIIFRDIEQAYLLSNYGFSKPSVILAGSVIEELLRLYLLNKSITLSNNTFDYYLKICESNGLLKKSVHRLSDSVRHFRNLVHVAKEESKKETISKATAKGSVASVFTLINDF